jgi:hypothetical protein
MSTPTTHSNNRRFPATEKCSLVYDVPAGHHFFLRKHGLAAQTVATYYTPSISIHTFSPVLERTRHSIKRVLQLSAHKEPDHIRQQAPKKLPRLVNGPLISRPAVPQDLPAFRAGQPTRWRREAPREPETRVVDVSQNLLRRGPFRARVVHRGWHVEP